MTIQYTEQYAEFTARNTPKTDTPQRAILPGGTRIEILQAPDTEMVTQFIVRLHFADGESVEGVAERACCPSHWFYNKVFSPYIYCWVFRSYVYGEWSWITPHGTAGEDWHSRLMD